GGGRGHQLTRQFQALWPEPHRQRDDAGEIAARPAEAGDKPNLDRVDPHIENDRNRCGRRLGRQCCRNGARGDHAHLAADQIGGHGRQTVVLPLSPAIFDRYVAALDVTGLAQSLAKRAHAIHIRASRRAAEKSDERNPALLRACRERPRGSRAAEQRDELAAFRSITSSARASSVGGISRPSAFAVLRLITNSNLVGSWTGRSPGFSPFSIAGGV